VLWRLVVCDLKARVGTLLLFGPVGVMGSIAFGAILGPSAGLPFLSAFLAWSHSTKMAGDDDKAGLWPFLRALPIPPAVVVGTQYVSGLIAAGLYVLLMTAAVTVASLVAPQSVSPFGVPATLLTSLAAAAIFVSLFNVFYFRLGYRLAQPIMQVLVFALPVGLIGIRVGGKRFVQWLFEVAARFGGGIGHPALLGLTMALGAAVLTALAWAYCVSSFRRREFP